MYTALKACKFAGKSYKVGDTIDASVILPTAAPRLCKMGVIAAVDGNVKTNSNAGGPLLPPASTIVSVPIHAEEGITSVEMAPDELVEVVSIIQLSEKEIIGKVKSIQSEDQLLLIAILNGSDAVFEATKARAEELNPDDAENETTTIYSKDELSKMKKDELLAIAADKGVEVPADAKNKDIVDLIVQKQGE